MMKPEPGTFFSREVLGKDYLKKKILEAEWSSAAHRWADALIRSFPEEKTWVRALGIERRDAYFLEISK
jgi:hypothetical protein